MRTSPTGEIRTREPRVTHGLAVRNPAARRLHWSGGQPAMQELVEESFPELVGDLAVDLASLVRQELGHAASEMERKARDAARNAMLCAVGVLLGGVALLVLTGALVLALGDTVPMWMSAAIVAGVLGVSGLAMYRAGRSALGAMTLMPTETFASLRADGAWAKQEIGATRDQMSATMTELRCRLALATAKKRRVPARRRTRKAVTP